MFKNKIPFETRLIYEVMFWRRSAMPKLFKMIIQAGSGNICNSVLIKKSKVIQGVKIEK
jgi:hypothetical protein